MIMAGSNFIAKTLYDKLWDSHVVHEDADGTCLIYIDRHLVQIGRASCRERVSPYV